MELLSAAAAGMMARLVCHPLDTTKTVAFTGFCGERHTPDAPRGTTTKNVFWSSTRSIYRQEGVPGFYRGVGVATLGSAPGVALYLTTYTWSNEFLQKYRNGALRDVPSWTMHLFCGFLAEAVSCVFWVPIDVTKERLQSQPPSQLGRYAGSWDALCTIARYEGLSGLYKCYATTVASFGPFSAVYFACYEALNDIFSKKLSLNSFASALCAGGMGNIVASIATNPLEFIKTRLQVQRAVLSVGGRPTTVHGFPYLYTGFFDGLRMVIREEGPLALWRGVGSRVAFAAPNAALTMAFYDYLRQE
ncbi:mitochondrial carrier protein [Trypanosoma conorhini]|uniref:Mitochondrial carrier protein n=1 Tax=Trypanosoma conorhini TaxID=83891 RepID=A0A422MU12_9TRYP|nr:mitochondrial carrier protein [Trypanosoma conorhini]RNE96738.1 mitochondrial carrier protein [Trypanosoma conorhini]